MKKIFITVCLAAMTFFLFLYPENCLESAKNGLNLWFSIVLPSLLPFMVASSILLETGIVRLLSFFFSPLTRVLFSAPGESAFIFLASALSGYPVGAKLAAQLYSKNQISENDAQTIIRFTSVSGPLFITGAVSSGLLGAPEAGIYLLSAHYLSAIFTGILFGLFRRRMPATKRKDLKSALNDFKKDISSCPALGRLLSESVERSIYTLAKIGGLIIVFSVVIEILSVSGVINAAAWVYSPAARLSGLSEESVRSMFIGGIEMTNGCKAASNAALGLPQKLPVVSSIIAFGGACIHMQTRSVCAASNLYPRRFLLTKSVQAVFAYAVCSLALIMFPVGNVQTASPPDIETAALCGIGFVFIALAMLLIIKLIKKRKAISA